MTQKSNDKQTQSTAFTVKQRAVSFVSISGLLLILGTGLAGCDSAENNLSDENRQEIFIMNAKDYVRSRLKDAKSAQFKNVFYSKASGTHVICGQVNSKNAYGGYGGYKYFVSGSPELTFFEDEVDDFAKIWNELCKS